MSDINTLSAAVSRPLKDTMNDPKMQWTRAPRTRRLLVVAYLFLLAAIPVASMAIYPVFVLIAALPVFVVLVGFLNLSTRGLTELRQSQLDEREGRMRDAAYRTMHMPAMLLGAAAVGVIAIAARDGTTLWLFGLAFSLWALGMLLPTILLAWTLPPELQEES